MCVSENRHGDGLPDEVSMYNVTSLLGNRGYGGSVLACQSLALVIHVGELDHNQVVEIGTGQEMDRWKVLFIRGSKISAMTIL